MVQILKEAEFTPHGDSARLVQLSADHKNEGQEVRARLNRSVIEFHRLFPNRKPKSFWLTTADMDNLVDAWLQYKTDQMQAEAAEQARQAEVLAEAYRLAREFKVEFEELHIEISEEENMYGDGQIYTVRVPALPYIGDRAYTVDGLLHEVKKAIGYVEDHIVYLESKGGQTDRDQRMIAAYRAVYPKQESKAGEQEPERGDYDNYESSEPDYSF